MRKILIFFSSILRSNKDRFPRAYEFFLIVGKKYFGHFLIGFPRVLANEMGAVKDVLRGPYWNMAYGKNLTHERLEECFAAYIGVKHAIAVNTGGMALQMSMRGLGLKPGNEVILQVDTCSATAFSVMNAGCTPIFSDISENTFMLDIEKLDELINDETKAIIATHMWGNVENIEAIRTICDSREIALIEDACLSLGAKSRQKMTGAYGNVGVFSFGCLKPIQGGEGGMIVTDDESLAKELRSLRHWGDKTIEYGIRDTTQLAWNGRMSEIVAAVVVEQLKGYPKYLNAIRNRIMLFQLTIDKIEGLELVLGNATSIENCAFTQMVLKIDESKLNINKDMVRSRLLALGVATWHANFEPINSLTFFRQNTWREWVIKGKLDEVALNYQATYPNANNVYNSIGLGLSKQCFVTDANLKHLIKQFEAVFK